MRVIGERNFATTDLFFEKETTDRLRAEKLPVRVIYREDDTVHCIWGKPSTADAERYVISLLPGEMVEFATDAAWSSPPRLLDECPQSSRQRNFWCRRDYRP